MDAGAAKELVDTMTAIKDGGVVVVLFAALFFVWHVIKQVVAWFKESRAPRTGDTGRDSDGRPITITRGGHVLTEIKRVDNHVKELTKSESDHRLETMEAHTRLHESQKAMIDSQNRMHESQATVQMGTNELVREVRLLRDGLDRSREDTGDIQRDIREIAKAMKD